MLSNRNRYAVKLRVYWINNPNQNTDHESANSKSAYISIRVSQKQLKSDNKWLFPTLN